MCQHLPAKRRRKYDICSSKASCAADANGSAGSRTAILNLAEQNPCRKGRFKDPLCIFCHGPRRLSFSPTDWDTEDCAMEDKGSWLNNETALLSHLSSSLKGNANTLSYRLRAGIEFGRREAVRDIRRIFIHSIDLFSINMPTREQGPALGT
ncbi:hypothetical protein PO124_15490 [Bacillus licheniformis]|nr:hypothetical protein [Bacillus licheniformis]